MYHKIFFILYTFFFLFHHNHENLVLYSAPESREIFFIFQRDSNFYSSFFFGKIRIFAQFHQNTLFVIQVKKNSQRAIIKHFKVLSVPQKVSHSCNSACLLIYYILHSLTYYTRRSFGVKGIQ